MCISESRCFNLHLLPTGQYPVPVLLKREQGALRPRRARSGCAGFGATCWFAQDGCARAESAARNSGSYVATKLCGDYWRRRRATTGMLRDTSARSGGSSDSAMFFFFEPGLWLKMPRFQLTLPFKWLCKALSRFPAHIRSRAGSVSLQNKHMGCKSCDSEDSPAIFLSAVAIGNRALQNTIYPGMQGDTELSKGTPVNPFLAKNSSGDPSRNCSWLSCM